MLTKQRIGPVQLLTHWEKQGDCVSLKVVFVCVWCVFVFVCICVCSVCFCKFTNFGGWGLSKGWLRNSTPNNSMSNDPVIRWLDYRSMVPSFKTNLLWLTPLFILPRSIKWVSRTAADFFKNKLSPKSDCGVLRRVNPIHKKGPVSFFLHLVSVLVVAMFLNCFLLYLCFLGHCFDLLFLRFWKALAFRSGTILRS